MKKYKRIIYLQITVLLTNLLLLSCSTSSHEASTSSTTNTFQPVRAPTKTPLPSSTPTPFPTHTPTQSYIDIMPKSWGKYARLDWDHDGSPFESELVTVYSDHVDTATKQRFAEETEKALERILTELKISEFDFPVPITKPKIEVYVSGRHKQDVGWEGYGHYGGFLVVYDEQFYRYQVSRFPDQFPFTYLITHEMTHTVMLRILGNKQEPTLPVPKWFDEGLATYMGIPPLPIRNQQLYDIAVRDKKDQFGVYFYTLNELMIYYLVETYEMENVVGILFDMRMRNLTFEEAFEGRVGISTDDFEQNFDSIIREFFAEE